MNTVGLRVHDVVLQHEHDVEQDAFKPEQHLGNVGKGRGVNAGWRARRHAQSIDYHLGYAQDAAGEVQQHVANGPSCCSFSAVIQVGLRGVFNAAYKHFDVAERPDVRVGLNRRGRGENGAERYPNHDENNDSSSPHSNGLVVPLVNTALHGREQAAYQAK